MRRYLSNARILYKRVMPTSGSDQPLFAPPEPIRGEVLVFGEGAPFGDEVDGQALGVVSMYQILANLMVLLEVSLDILPVYGINLPFDAHRSFGQRWGNRTQIITFVQTEPDGGLYLLRERFRITPPYCATTPLCRGRADGGIRVIPDQILFSSRVFLKGWVFRQEENLRRQVLLA